MIVFHILTHHCIQCILALYLQAIQFIGLVLSDCILLSFGHEKEIKGTNQDPWDSLDFYITKALSPVTNLNAVVNNAYLQVTT